MLRVLSPGAANKADYYPPIAYFPTLLLDYELLMCILCGYYDPKTFQITHVFASPTLPTLPTSPENFERWRPPQYATAAPPVEPPVSRDSRHLRDWVTCEVGFHGPNQLNGDGVSILTYTT